LERPLAEMRGAFFVVTFAAKKTPDVAACEHRASGGVED